MSKPGRQLDQEIAESLSRGDRLPHYTSKKGWIGGGSKTLYAYTDKRTGNVVVRPGGGSPNIGPEATVRLATRAEAERLWQSPLHSGWKVAP